jgi:uncharacterized damage-inducible protein DinB
MKPSQIFSHWDQVRADLIATIDMFNEDELMFVPFEGSWPVGKIMLHIADCENYWLHFVVRHEIEVWSYYDLVNHPTKIAVKGVLEAVRKKTIPFLANLEVGDLNLEYKTPEGQSYTLRWIIWHVLEHEIHHRGELSLALGLLGRQGLDV